MGVLGLVCLFGSLDSVVSDDRWIWDLEVVVVVELGDWRKVWARE